MDLLIKVMFFVLGACLGSFYACIGYRIPNKISTIKPSSYCPKCNKTLKWYMNIPLVSYIMLKGRCAYCKEKISITYFLIELLTATLFLGSYILFGINYNLIIILTLISALMITLVTDLNYFYISDRVIVVSSLIILITRFYYLLFKECLTYVISGLILFTIMYLIKLIGDKVLKKECLGGGDIKLMVPIGLSLGIYHSLIALFIGSTKALIFTLSFKNKEEMIPYGPFLLIGTIISFIIKVVLGY